eukprot:COSAG06_NODE_66020_length_255_cov_0.974359_1_plen_23_part_10
MTDRRGLFQDGMEQLQSLLSPHS